MKKSRVNVILNEQVSKNVVSNVVVSNERGLK